MRTVSGSMARMCEPAGAERATSSAAATVAPADMPTRMPTHESKRDVERVAVRSTVHKKRNNGNKNTLSLNVGITFFRGEQLRGRDRRGAAHRQHDVGKRAVHDLRHKVWRLRQRRTVRCRERLKKTTTARRDEMTNEPGERRVYPALDRVRFELCLARNQLRTCN